MSAVELIEKARRDAFVAWAKSDASPLIIPPTKVIREKDATIVTDESSEYLVYASRGPLGVLARMSVSKADKTAKSLSIFCANARHAVAKQVAELEYLYPIWTQLVEGKS